MEVILFCDGQARCIPGESMPEALLPYCNIPLIARILRFLSDTSVTGVTLCRADPKTRDFVESLPLRLKLRWMVPERLAADTLVLHRLSLPEWDMGELAALCGNAPVRLLHPDGSETHAALCPAGTAPCRPERTANVVLSVFDRADTSEQYLLLQRRLLERGGMERFRIGQGTRFGRHAQADAATVIGSDCLIGEHAVLERCCLGDGVQIGAGAVLRDCVIGSRALVDRQVCLSGRSVPVGAVIAPQTDEPVFPQVRVREEDGICRELPRWNNAETALQAGAAMTALGTRLVIGCDAPEGEAAALAAAAGAVSQGAQVWNAGRSVLSQLIDLCSRVCAEAILWVKAGAVLQLRPCMAGGFSLETAQQRRLQQALESEVSTRIPECGKLHDASQLLPLWEDGIRSILPELPCEVEVSCGNPLLREAAERLFSGGKGERIVLSLSEDGTQVSAFTGDAGMLHHEQLLLMSLLSFRETGEALALSADFHPAAEGFAARFGGRILRLHTPRTSPQAARLWRQQGVCMDGMRLFAHVLRVLAKRQLTLADAAALLPPMATVRRAVSTTLNASDVENLRRENPDPAVRLVRPAFASLARLLVHAADMETAAELCDFWEKRIRARETGQCAETIGASSDF